jgi:hypothetical protein
MIDRDRETRPEATIETWRAAVARAGFVAVAVLLVAGLALALAGVGLGATLLASAIALLASMPVTNVIALLVEELRRGEWRFAAAAVLVLALLALSLLTSSGP